MKKAVTELLIVAFIALILGTVANAARSRGSLKWTKAYFASRGEAVVDAPPALTRSAGSSETPPPIAANTPEVVASATGEDVVPSVAKASDAQPDHGLQVITTNEVAEIVGSSGEDYDRGLYVFVDARNENAYREGHIPGAIRCYHYELDLCIDELVEFALSSERVIVYCNGGTCEDSKYMCQELIDRDVPRDIVYLYEDGWKAWSERGDLPIVEGDE